MKQGTSVLVCNRRNDGDIFMCKEQGEIMLAASAVIGLAVLTRAGRLKTLGLDEDALLALLDKRFAAPAI